MTSYRPSNLFQASFELELQEGSYPVFTRPHHFEVLVLVNSRHFQKSDKKRYGLRSPDLEPPTISSNPGSLGFPGCTFLALLRPVPPTLALSSQRSRSVPRPVVLHVQSRTPLVPLSGPVIFPVLGRRVQTNQYCNPIPGSSLWGFALVTRPLLSCGRWFLTHWRYPQSALGGGVSGSFGRSVLKPKLFAAGLLSFVPSLALLHKFQVIPKFPILAEHDVSLLMPSLAPEMID